MINSLLIGFGQLTSLIIKRLNFGHGSTWPGHIALKINKNFISQMLEKSNIRVIIVAGTNGKTTTAKMIRTILAHNGKSIIQNPSGANLLNGIASSLILHSSILSTLNYDYAIFEADENALPLIIKEITPDYLLLLNLFRDQLDRYGEVNTISQKWRKALKTLPEETILILNADDPQIAFLGKKSNLKTMYFGLQGKEQKKVSYEHAADTTYCPNCGTKLIFKALTYSHLGDWRCPSCKLEKPTPNLPYLPYLPLSGTYNKYNALAAALLAKIIGLSETQIESSLRNFKPAFGRQEKLTVDGKQVQLFLSKNPTGFNESLRTIKELKAKTVLLLLNDGIADGRDVSWIWDVDFEDFVSEFEHIIVSGSRTYDMGLRVKYAFSKNIIHNTKYIIQNDLSKALNTALEQTSRSETLFILPTYTAMLETRKILTGKKIL